MGYIGMITEAILIVIQIFFGVLIDTFGRKVPLITSLTFAGLAMGLIPVMRTLYPGFFILRILMGVGTTIA